VEHSGTCNEQYYSWNQGQSNKGKCQASFEIGAEKLAPTLEDKFEEIANLIKDDSYSGGSHGWIIFCQFREEITLLHQYLEAFNFIGKVREYHGGMSMDERNAAVEGSRTFTDGLQDVLLIQLHAGGTGLNLQHYDRVVFTSPWWTAALLDQALGRALRIGQKNVVQVYWLRLQSESIFNIDEFVLEKSETKRDLANTFHTWSIQI
jgi:SNF2 family DNA or RNA helicase